MRTGGAITVLIMGIFTTILMIITFFIGGMSASIFSDETVAKSIWDSSGIGFLLAIGLIILGSVGLKSRSVIVGILIIASCVYGYTLSVGMFSMTGTETPIIGFVLIVFMLISTIGGVLNVLGSLLEQRNRKR